MYAHHNTDPEEVLPCNRNNCRCGNDQNCMYYNNADSAHYNYTAVHGTGDKNGPFYKCNNLAFDSYNQEQLYGDHAINGLGGYNDGHPYGGVNDPKGWYGPMDVSYPAKPTCQGYANNNPVKTEHDGHDYDQWDRYHKYHAGHKVWNVGGGGMLPQMTMGGGGTRGCSAMNLAMLAAVAFATYWYWNRAPGSKRTKTLVVGGVAFATLAFFFFKLRLIQ